MAAPSATGIDWGRWLMKPMRLRDRSPHPWRLASRPRDTPVARASWLAMSRLGVIPLTR